MNNEKLSVYDYRYDRSCLLMAGPIRLLVITLKFTNFQPATFYAVLSWQRRQIDPCKQRNKLAYTPRVFEFLSGILLPRKQDSTLQEAFGSLYEDNETQQPIHIWKAQQRFYSDKIITRITIQWTLSIGICSLKDSKTLRDWKTVKLELADYGQFNPHSSRCGIGIG